MTDDVVVEILLVALVEMAADAAEAGQRYEDEVLALLPRHGGTLERRLREPATGNEVHVIRFAGRAGYESFMVDPDRLALRARYAGTAPSARVLEVAEV